MNSILANDMKTHYSVSNVMFIAQDLFNRLFSPIVNHVRLHIRWYRELFGRKLNQHVTVRYIATGDSIHWRKRIAIYLSLKTVIASSVISRLYNLSERKLCRNNSS